MRRRTLQLTLTATLLLVQCSAWADLDQRKQSADQFPSDVAWTWFEALYNVVKQSRRPHRQPHGSTASRLSRSTSRLWQGRKGTGHSWAS